MFNILFLIIILLVLIFAFNDSPYVEKFQWDLLDVGKNAVDCYSQNDTDCLKFSNCGICFKNGVTKCIPGDVEGSFFSEGCDLFKYTNYYDGYIFDEKKTTTNTSWDHFKHGYEAVYPGPTEIFTL